LGSLKIINDLADFGPRRPLKVTSVWVGQVWLMKGNAILVLLNQGHLLSFEVLQNLWGDLAILEFDFLQGSYESS